MEFIDNWYRQAKAIVTQPKEFFRKMQTTGGFGDPFRFAILNMFLAFALSCGFRIAIPDMEFQHALQYFGTDIWMFSLIMMPAALILGSIGLFLFSGINHLFLKLVGAKNSYEATFRVFAYLSVF
ncbi:MAG: YIP1 family protein, partial [archaeon]|nr:YIP1 family protein [archaeon]